MGAGLIRERVPILPDLETFEKITTEYDKLKTAGLSAAEIHSIINIRLNGLSNVPNSRPTEIRTSSLSPDNEKSDHFMSNESKSDEIRSTETSDHKIVLNNIIQPAQRNTALIIDDSPVAAKVASKVLTNLNFDVITAESAQSGYDILKARKDEIKIVFLDVVMPNVDGVECLSWIKGDPTVANIPVYMLSGLDDQTLMDVCIENGAEGMLLKPLNANIVKDILKQNFSNIPPTMPTTALHSSMPTINPNSPNVENPSMLLLKPPVYGTSTSNTPYRSESPNYSPNKPIITTISHTESPVITPVKPIITYDITLPSIQIGHQATAFRLTDSDLKEFTYPSITNKKNIIFLFLPTIFLPDLYVENTGFLRWFFEFYEYIIDNNINVICITNDLPNALNGAKLRFNLPFQCLSDPTLIMSKKYIGTFNVGLYLANQKGNNNNLHNFKDQINQIGSNVGLVLIDKNRTIINKWIGINLDGTLNFQNNFPDIKLWINHIITQDDINYKNESKEFSNMLELINVHNIIPNGLISTTGSGMSSPIPKKQNSILRQSNTLGIASPLNHSNIKSKNSQESFSSTSSLNNKNIINKGNNNKNVGFNKIINTSTGSITELINDKYILVVDDSSVSSRVVMKKLESLGYKPECAYNGLIAFDMLKKEPNKYFLVLVDIMMPICDGIEFLKMIKNEINLKNILVIMLSGLNNTDLQANCMNLGAAGIMKKPFDENVFQDIISRYQI